MFPPPSVCATDRASVGGCEPINTYKGSLMKHAQCLSAAASAIAISFAVAADEPVLRIDHNNAIPLSSIGRINAPTITFRGVDPCCAAPAALEGAGIARHGQAVPGGGTLSPIAFANPAILDPTGRIAFIAGVDGADRNQGVFFADSTGLIPIAMGCGGGGGSGDPGTGCGDPSPIGGTFSGFFGGTLFAPAVNANGDVLFFADVDAESDARGLFLYRADTDDIVKVVVNDDPSPIGGTLENVGPGSLNAARQVVFVARNSGQGDFEGNFYKWENGVITKIAAIGDPAPDGGTFAFLGREFLGYADGSTIPGGPVPAINDAGLISFPAVVSGGPVERGILLSDGTTHSWAVRNTDATPAGGIYLDLAAANLNASGELVFYADVRLGPSEFTGAIFAGAPGSIRKVLAFFDPVAGGECFGLAFSRNPIQAIDNCGNVILWTNVRLPSTLEREHTILAMADGQLIKLAGQTDPAPGGGSFGTMNAWITINNERQYVVSAGTPGAPGGSFNAHFVYSGLRTGDINNDGVVDLGDLAVLLSNFGSSGATFDDGDFNADGVVDLADLALLLAAFGTSC